MVARDLDRTLSFFPNLPRVAVVVCLLAVLRRRKAAARKIPALAAYCLHIDFLVWIAGDELKCDLEDVGIKGACKSFVAADDNQQHALLGPYGKQRVTQVARS